MPNLSAPPMILSVCPIVQWSVSNHKNRKPARYPLLSGCLRCWIAAIGVTFDRYYPHPQPSISEVIPRSQYPATPPQVIVIKKSHRRDRSGRHRSHSHFQSSEPVVIPQPVTHSDSNSSLYHTTPSAVGHQYSRILDFPRPPHHPNVGCIVPDLAQNFTPGPSTAPMPFSLCSSCTGRKKALCVNQYQFSTLLVSLIWCVT